MISYLSFFIKSHVIYTLYLVISFQQRNFLSSEKNLRATIAFYIFSCDRNLTDIIIFRNLIHNIQHIFFQNCPKSSG